MYDDIAQACGLDSSAIDFGRWERPLHKGLVNPVADLKAAAQHAGFTLVIASGYRDFDRQLYIWNGKASGQRAVEDSAGRVFDIATLNDNEKMWAIMRWSALPGASRHHFGTEVDIYDPTLLPSGEPLKLNLQEVEGVFAPFHQWLDEYLSTSNSGFFRPYVLSDFGVAAEPWHLSYGPLAQPYQRCLTLAALTQVISDADIFLKSSILSHLPIIYERYIQVPWALYPSLPATLR